MSWLLDTNVLSELKRPRPEPSVVAFMAGCRLDELFVSSVTLAEIRFGIERAPDAGRQADLLRWLADEVRPMFDGRVLEITEDVLLRWRVLVEEGRRTGRNYSQPDLMIAATALEHGSKLVTRNERDFTGLGLKIVNPWADRV
jgi:predicted nucleic acid-binding protein